MTTNPPSKKYLKCPKCGDMILQTAPIRKKRCPKPECKKVWHLIEVRKNNAKQRLERSNDPEKSEAYRAKTRKQYAARKADPVKRAKLEFSARLGRQKHRTWFYKDKIPSELQPNSVSPQKTKAPQPPIRRHRN